MLLDSSRWLFSKYQIFIIFSIILFKIFKLKIIHWYAQYGQLCHVLWDRGSNYYEWQVSNVWISFFLSGSLVARIHLIRWLSGMSEVRTPTHAYNNALSYQLSYVHETSKCGFNHTFELRFIIFCIICSLL